MCVWPARVGRTMRLVISGAKDKPPDCGVTSPGRRLQALVSGPGPGRAQELGRDDVQGDKFSLIVCPALALSPPPPLAPVGRLVAPRAFQTGAWATIRRRPKLRSGCAFLSPRNLDWASDETVQAARPRARACLNESASLSVVGAHSLAHRPAQTPEAVLCSHSTKL